MLSKHFTKITKEFQFACTNLPGGRVVKHLVILVNEGLANLLILRVKICRHFYSKSSDTLWPALKLLLYRTNLIKYDQSNAKLGLNTINCVFTKCTTDRNKQNLTLLSPNVLLSFITF